MSNTDLLRGNDYLLRCSKTDLLRWPKAVSVSMSMTGNIIMDDMSKADLLSLSKADLIGVLRLIYEVCQKLIAKNWFIMGTRTNCTG